jgi:spore germination protein KA
MFFPWRSRPAAAHGPATSESDSRQPAPISDSLDQNLAWLNEQIGHSADLVLRRLEPAAAPGTRLLIAYLDGLVDQAVLNVHIVQALQQAPARNEVDTEVWMGQLARCIVSSGAIQTSTDLEDALGHIMKGMCVIMAEGARSVLAAEVSGGEQRSVEEPKTQAVLRGPQRSFTENIRTNVSLVRRIIHSPELCYEEWRIGRRTKTAVGLLYMKGITNESIVATVRERLSQIDIDGVLESNYIEEYIQDRQLTPFPTLLNTERPDATAGALLEGQLAIIVDGTPFVLLGPVSVHKFFQSPEDYYQRLDIATFLRLIRYSGFLISMLLPAAYIAITTFHQETLPTQLLFSLLGQREGIPLPALVEALLMELTFEVLREAGARLPRAIGPAISIVGALVLGQAAVQAGIISPAMIIVVAFTAISNFVMPQLNIAIAARLIRFALMIAAGMLGFFGIFAGLLVIAIHLTGLTSFGVPYMGPLAPLVPSGLIDTFVRAPFRAMKKRPALMRPEESTRRPKGKGGGTP